MAGRPSGADAASSGGRDGTSTPGRSPGGALAALRTAHEVRVPVSATTASSAAARRPAAARSTSVHRQSRWLTVAAADHSISRVPRVVCDLRTSATHVSRDRRRGRRLVILMMSLSRLVITAVVLERQTVAEVSGRYGVHRSWVYRLLARYRAEGEAAFAPRSRRPHHCPTAVPAATVELICPAARRADRGRAGRRPGDHRLAPGTPPPADRGHRHDRPLPGQGRAGRPTTPQATPLLLHPVPGRAAERDLAGRLHPLPAGHRPGRRGAVL